MKNLQFKILMLLISLLPGMAMANWTGNQVPEKIYGSQIIRFGVNSPPQGKVCNYHDRHFYFDATTEAGKNMLTILLAAEMSNRRLDIWFDASTLPDTDQNNGCHPNTMAKVYALGIVD